LVAEEKLIRSFNLALTLLKKESSISALVTTIATVKRNKPETQTVIGRNKLINRDWKSQIMAKYIVPTISDTNKCLLKIGNSPKEE
jgi:hypothetical protein